MTEVIYSMPVWVAFAFMILISVLWGLICRSWCMSRPQGFWTVNQVLKWVILGVILFGTIASRFLMNLPDIWFDMVPFDGISADNMTIGGWYNVVTNLLIFEPVGLVFVNLYGMYRTQWKAFGFTVLNGFIFSLFIEIVQFVFNWGAFELEDIICNTAGAAIGAASIFISRR